MSGIEVEETKSIILFGEEGVEYSEDEIMTMAHPTDRALSPAATEPMVSALPGDDRLRKAVNDDHFRNAQRLAKQNSGLRIAFWNFMRAAGVSQDMAIKIIREAAGE